MNHEHRSLPVDTPSRPLTDEQWDRVRMEPDPVAALASPLPADRARAALQSVGEDTRPDGLIFDDTFDPNRGEYDRAFEDGAQSVGEDTPSHEDEYDALARQLHESIAQGQSVALTAKALRALQSVGEDTPSLDAERLARAMRNVHAPTGLLTDFDAVADQYAAEYARLTGANR